MHAAIVEKFMRIHCVNKEMLGRFIIMGVIWKRPHKELQSTRKHSCSGNEEEVCENFRAVLYRRAGFFTYSWNVSITRHNPDANISKALNHIIFMKYHHNLCYKNTINSVCCYYFSWKNCSVTQILFYIAFRQRYLSRRKSLSENYLRRRVHHEPRHGFPAWITRIRFLLLTVMFKTMIIIELISHKTRFLCLYCYLKCMFCWLINNDAPVRYGQKVPLSSERHAGMSRACFRADAVIAPFVWHSSFLTIFYDNSDQLLCKSSFGHSLSPWMVWSVAYSGFPAVLCAWRTFLFATARFWP